MKFKSLFCFAALLALSLVGCGSSSQPHTHSYDKESAEWVWKDNSSGGYDAKVIFTCTGCSEDTEGHTTEVNANVESRQTLAPTCTTAGTVLYTATATFEGQTFTATKEKTVSDSSAHHFAEVAEEAYLKSPATCTEDAVYYKSCEFCHEKSEETFAVANSKLGHHLVHHEAAESTCQVQGNIEYYECDRCGILFLDESASNETTIDDVLLPTAHRYLEVAEEAYLKSAATCTEDAVYFKSCEFCHEKGEETFVAANTKLGHHLVHHAATESTCQVQGNIEYYKCDRCGILFLDESASNETTIDDVLLPTAHRYLEVAEEAYLKSPATCTEDAVYYKSCEFCHEKNEETFTVANSKLGHHLIHHQAAESTCQVQGNIEYYECDRCNKLFLDENATNEATQQDILLPLTHRYVEVVDNAYLKSAATCTEDAVYYKSCQYCHEKNDETFTVANSKLGHHLVHHDAVESTCQVQGNIEYYECDRCNKLFLDENATNETTAQNVLLPLTHKMTYHAGSNATCTADGSHAYYTCEYEDGVLYKDENANEKYNNASELVIDKLGHSFDESLKCSRCNRTLKEEYGMSDATAIDGIDPVTVSNLGFTSGSYMRTGSEGHTFLDYNFLANGGADIWMNYRYSFADGNYDEASAQWYILNNHSEDGLRIRLDSRAENDGIAVLYVYSSGQCNNPGTDDDILSGPNGSAMFFFPRPSQFKANTDITLHFAITLTDPVKNIFNVKIEAGSNGTLYQTSTGAESGDYSPRSFNIEMGEDFTGWVNKSIRFTAKRSEDITISDVASAESVLVYKDAAGNIVGKLDNPGTAKLPALVANNKTFIGWFDPQGNRINDGDAITTKKIVTPRFVDSQTNMFVPSDTLGNEFAAAKGGWYESTAFGGECGGQLPTSEVNDRYDVYFIYQFVSRSNGDNYAIFGFPFDFIDAKTRVHLRIDNPTNGNLVGYIYGGATNLGGAGGAGTNFSQAGFRSNGANLLVHMAIYYASVNGFTLLVEITNLGDGQVYQTTREVTFNDATLYAIDSPTRNIFDLMKANCEYRITDAF